MDKQLEALMRLGLTAQEAKQVLEDDKRIDRGEKLFELTEEQKQAERKAKNVDVKTVYNFQKRERKADEIKQGLIELLAGVVKEQPMCNSLEITNPEREFLFMWAGKKYKVVLSAPRS